MQDKIGLAIIIHNEIELLDQFIEANKIKELFKEIKFLDDFSDDGTYKKLIEYSKQNWCEIYRRKLNFDFSAQRNYLNTLMLSDYIMRLDVDEIMSDKLIEYISNFKGGSDLYFVHREETVNNEIHGYQSTPLIYKNNKKITWINRIHECINGHYSKEYISTEFLLIHDKTHERCDRQNHYYYDNWEEQRKAVDEPI